MTTDIEMAHAPEMQSSPTAKKAKDRSFAALMRKSTLRNAVEQEKNHKLSYVYGLVSAVFFGTASILAAEISRLGLKALPTMSFGILAPYLFYHAYSYVKWRQDGCKNGSYLCMANSMYCFELEDSDDEEQSAVDIQSEQGSVSDQFQEGGATAPSQKLSRISASPLELK